MISIDDRLFDDFDEALKSIDPFHSGTVVIKIEGTVTGQHTIDKPGLIIRGGRFVCDCGAYDPMPGGEKTGTFRSYTLYVDADRVCFDKCEIINTAGSERGQAIALMIDGDEVKLRNCRISSMQDTLFIGPLPEKEYEAGGFKGPMEHKDRIVKHAFFLDCLIEGSVDFIFGSGFGYFKGCSIRSLSAGYVLAPSTHQSLKYGFILDSCDFSADMTDECVYLARPWRPHAKTMTVNCSFGKHIRHQGYTDWGRDMSEVEFKECGNSSKSSEYVKDAGLDDLAALEKYRAAFSFPG